MPVTTTKASKTFQGNGVTTVFSCDFRIFAATDVAVSLVNQSAGTSSPMVLNTDYVVSGANDDAGFTITTIVPVAAGRNLSVVRAIAYTQPTSFSNQSRFFPILHQDMGDRLAMQIQQIRDSQDRALTLPPGLFPSGNGQMPYPQPGTLLGWSADGTQLVNLGPTGVGAGQLRDVNIASDAGINGQKVAYQQVGVGAELKTLQTKLAESISVTDFGARADSNGTIGNGTDNTAAFQRAIANALASGISRIYIPAGSGYYRFSSASAPLDPGNGNLTFFGDGADSSRILFEEGTDTASNRKNLFSNTTTTLKGFLEFDSIGFFGTLTQKSFVEGGGVVLFLNYYQSISVHDCKFYDLSFMATACEAIRNVRFTDNHCERIVRDSCRFRSSFNCIVTGNFFKHNSDDSVALHQANYITGAGNIRDSIIVSDNIFEDANGIRIWGARKATVSNNTMNRCKVDPISILGDATEGDNPMFEIYVTDNKIYDPLAAPPFSSALQQVIGINSLGRKGGSQSAGLIPGENNTGNGQILAVYGYLNNNITAGTVTSAPALFGVYVTGNVIARTLPAATNYTDWGFGQAFSPSGFVNPSVADASLRPLQGLFIDGNVRRAKVVGNTFANLTQGLAFSASGGNFGLDSVLVADNTFYDVLDSGVYFQAPAAARTADIRISRNHFNLDPYFLSANRAAAANGSFTADGAPYAMGGSGYQGIVFTENTLSNLGKVTSNAFDVSTVYRNNICRCNPSQVGFSTSNVGVGNVPPPGLGQAWVHQIIDSNPKSATYLAVVNETLLTSNGLPTTGKYVQGHFVQNTNYSLAIAGYVRLTTGSAHVGGTDWKSVTLA